jgi:hypothetical protein
MLNPMPHHNLAKHLDMSNMKLEDFFGFCLAEVTCPKNNLRPLLPYKSNDDRTIYPVGTWTGVYFSEELKAVKEQGYTIKLIEGYEFSKAYIFKDYVEHFYSRKKESTGAERFIAKMHLNQLYGIFGRKLETIETINVNAQQLKIHMVSSNIKSIIEIDDDLFAVMLYSNSKNDMLEKLNSQVDSVVGNTFKPEVKSNVAIAAAVTAYSRIHMIPFKLDDGICYTDTDSIFTTNELPEDLVGKELGLMKDELDGTIIDEAYFLGIKKYGYTFLDGGVKKDASVFSGVKRNSLSFDEVTNIANGYSITVNLPDRLYKSLRRLNVEFKASKLTITSSDSKPLIDNLYRPSCTRD